MAAELMFSGAALFNFTQITHMGLQRHTQSLMFRLHTRTLPSFQEHSFATYFIYKDKSSNALQHYILHL